MACFLHIETSTNVCSVSLSHDHHLVWNEEDFTGRNHSVSLGVYVDQALSYLDHDGLTLDAVAVSGGPGSYTGLRIGTSIAKGVCYGRDAKLVSVPTLELMCVPVLLNDKYLDEDMLFCPMLDARRMEVYAQVFDRSLKSVRDIQADVVDENTYLEYLNEHKVCFFGNGAEKCKSVINHPNAIFIDGIEPLAKNMSPLAEKRLHRGEVEDVAYYTPFYLKEYEAKLPKNLLNPQQ